MAEKLEILFNYNVEQQYCTILTWSNELTCKEESTIYRGTCQTLIIVLKMGTMSKNAWNQQNKENQDDSSARAPVVRQAGDKSSAENFVSPLKRLASGSVVNWNALIPIYCEKWIFPD